MCCDTRSPRRPCRRGSACRRCRRSWATTVSRPRRSTSALPTCTSRTSSSGSGENRLIPGMSRKLGGLCQLNETAPRWERLRTRSSPHGVNKLTPLPCADLWPQLFSDISCIALWVSSEKILTRLYSVLHWFHKRLEVNVKNPRENRCFQIVIVFSFGSIDNSNKCTVL